MSRIRFLPASALAFALLAVAQARAADVHLPPFDFSNAFYAANGIDPAAVLGRPNGTPPNSVIDNRENGPDLNNVRLLEQTAAFDHSGHPIFFYVTGVLPATLAPFLPNQAGQEAFEIAEEFKVWEFPRAANPQFSVFPKRQDLIADLSGGYFSNNPLGIWQINHVRYTPAALNTPQGQQALAELAARNGVDLDGTPLVRTKSEVMSLASRGFVTIETPPIGGTALRWFFCPVIEDPRDGAIAPDAHLTIVRLSDGSPLPAEREILELFLCLQTTGDECGDGGFGGRIDRVGFGTASTCPCGNADGSANGCLNSSGVGGRLTGSGTARVSSDSVVLSASQLTGNTSLFIQGSALGSIVLGDGLRVADGDLVRLGTRVNAAGSSTFPAGGGATLSTLGAVQPGATRTYQVWYRNAASFCTPASFNLTNGVRVVWAP